MFIKNIAFPFLMKYDVFGIGNALIDILIEADEKKIRELRLSKGNAHYLTEAEIKSTHNKLKDGDKTVAPGGSVANTASGIANLGGSVVFCGCVGNDGDGVAYEKGLIKSGVIPRMIKCNGITGNALTFITKDKERTFAVHLGVAGNLEKGHISEEDIKNSRILHVEGYQLANPATKEAVLHAMGIAKSNKVLVSMDLSDSKLVENNLGEFKKIAKDYVDILFSNEEEARAFTGKSPEKALNEIAKMVDIAIVKIGKKGSLIKQKDKIYRITGIKAKAVDTTGAGDMYAAGILYGLARGMSLEKAGKIASYAAARVVEQIGARLDYSLKDFVKSV